MAEDSLFWSTEPTQAGHGQLVTEARWRAFWRALAGNDPTRGILFAGSSPLSNDSWSAFINYGPPDGIGFLPGAAIVDGVPVVNDTNHIMAVDYTGITQATAGLVVLRLDAAAETVTPALVWAANGSQAVPAPTQNASIFELPIASIVGSGSTISSLTDLRQIALSAGVAGRESLAGYGAVPAYGGHVSGAGWTGAGTTPLVIESDGLVGKVTGSVAIPAIDTNTASVDVRIDFPAGIFTDIPTLKLQIFVPSFAIAHGGAVPGAIIRAIDLTGADVRIRRLQITSQQPAGRLLWIATGPE